MSLRLFLTADVHLAPKPGSYPDRVAEGLREARFETLERMVRLATEKACRLFVVAGDLFDQTGMSKTDIRRAATILGGFDGISVVLPGNHDHAEGTDLWRSFREGRDGTNNVLFLDTLRPYPLKEAYGIDATLYPAPCNQRHAPQHCLAWIDGCPRDSSVCHHIGIAHGALEGLSADNGRYYPMTREDLTRTGLDLWLLGHVHVPYPAGTVADTAIYYPGTPEPDGFDCAHSGHSWLIEIDGAFGEKKDIRAEKLSTGKYRFLREQVDVSDPAEAARLAERFSDPRFRSVLMELHLTGSVARDDLEAVARQAEALRPHFFHLELDRKLLTRRITVEDIQRDFTPGFFPHKLLTELSRSADDQNALQLAYELLLQARGEGARS